MPPVYFHIYVLTAKQKISIHTMKFCLPLVFHMNEIKYF